MRGVKDVPTKRLFASDIDGTLLVADRPDPSAVGRFGAWCDAHPDVTVAYVTGRSHAGALEVIEAHGLPRPDVLVGSVGTDMRWWRADDWLDDDTWTTRLARALGGRDFAVADAIVLESEGAALQEDAEQSRFKRSYRRRDAAFDRDAIASRLGARGLTVNVIASIDPRTGHGLLDLLPRDTDKGSAVEHLRARLGLDTDAVAFSGDSGNDLAALDRPWWSIVVGNAPESVRARFAAGFDRKRRSVVTREEVLPGVLEGLEAIGWMA